MSVYRSLSCSLAVAAAFWLNGCLPLPFLSPAQSYLDPETAGRDYEAQGEYVGGSSPIGVQVVALGDDDFEAVFYRGGLPGAGWDGTPRVVEDGHREKDGTVRFDGDAKLVLGKAGATGVAPWGEALSLKRVERESPTLGAPPPPGAVVLFDGTGTERIEGTMDAQGHLKAGATSADSFRDFHLHLEFRTPFTPKGWGQFRGNSGVYLQGRYEVQVLDSFGLPEKDNDCGGIYQVSVPAVNMSFPPLRWQTYDIDFTAARFDAAGGKVAPARVTVDHNGLRIHDDVEIGGSTGGGTIEQDSPGPIHLQDHWDPVVYRNVWVLPR